MRLDGTSELLTETIVVWRCTFRSQRTGEQINGYTGDLYINGHKEYALCEHRSEEALFLEVAKIQASNDRAKDFCGR